jgi:cysteine desulfurase
MIYLDYQAATPLAPEARDAMLAWLGDEFANPNSPHRDGRRAAAAIASRSRSGQPPLCTVRRGRPGRPAVWSFTSGATEGR